MKHLTFKLTLGSLFVFAALCLWGYIFIKAEQLNPVLADWSPGCEGSSQSCSTPARVRTSDEFFRLIQSMSVSSQNPEAVDYPVGMPTLHECKLRAEIDWVGQMADYGLEDCQGIYLGDIIQRYGTNLKIWMDGHGNGIFEYLNTTYKIMFEFSGGLQPFAKIKRIGTNPIASGLPFAVFDWHGFSPQWKYCQFEPENFWCATLPTSSIE